MGSSLNLLYVHESMGSLGGAETNVFITATKMKRRGHRVGLLTRRATGRNESAWQELFGDDIFWITRTPYELAATTFSASVTYVHKWDDLASLADIVNSGRPRIRMVHDHDMYCLRSYRYSPFTRKICRRPTSAYCIFPCLAPLKRERGSSLGFRLISYAAKKRERDLSRQFHRHLVVTHYMREELEINGFDPAGIEIFPPVPWAGQIIRGKGLDVLLQALTRVEAPLRNGRSRRRQPPHRLSLCAVFPLARTDRHHWPRSHALRPARHRLGRRGHQGLAHRRPQRLPGPVER
ncbi:MAG: glycosyltransferase [Candidatus Synoicihabitans palmerolidicus]|nr:glycosyltransferase [Candidatus Synoicihabitans palmerolidicus]